MAKRIILLAAALWAGLCASQWLARVLINLARASVVENVWALWLGIVLPVAVAAFFTARWRGLVGRRLVLTTVAAVVAIAAVCLITGVAISALPRVRAIDSLGEAAAALLYGVYALEAAAVCWLLPSTSLGIGAPDFKFESQHFL